MQKDFFSLGEHLMFGYTAYPQFRSLHIDQERNLNALQILSTVESLDQTAAEFQGSVREIQAHTCDPFREHAS